MNALDDQMARDHQRDMFSDSALRELHAAIAAALTCSRVEGTKLATELEVIREKVREYRAQITKAWD